MNKIAMTCLAAVLSAVGFAACGGETGEIDVQSNEPVDHCAFLEKKVKETGATTGYVGCRESDDAIPSSIVSFDDRFFGKVDCRISYREGTYFPTYDNNMTENCKAWIGLS